MFRSPCFIAAGLMFLFASGAALAGSSTPAPFNISTAQDFAQQATTVRSGLQPGGEYASLSARNRDRVMRNIDFMSALMQRRGSIQAMSGSERVQMFNAQSQTNRLLSGDSSNSVTCGCACCSFQRGGAKPPASMTPWPLPPARFC